MLETIDARHCSMNAAIAMAVDVAVRNEVPIGELTVTCSASDAEHIRIDFGSDAALFWDKPGMLVRTVAGPMRVEAIRCDDPWPKAIIVTRSGEPWCEVRIRD